MRDNAVLKKVGCLCVLTGGMLLAVSPSSWAGGQVIKGKHFIVHFNSTRAFAQKVLRKAEREYERITKNLGFSRYEYWTFEDRCALYVYGDKESYLRSRPGIPAWSSGYAEYKKGEGGTHKIAGFRGSDKFLTTILPHEITHLIFNDFVGSEVHVPKWFSEGVALAQEEEGRELFKQKVGKALHRHYFIPLYLLHDEVFKGVHNYNFTYLAYAQAALLTDFLIAHFGRDRFVQLCRHMKDGKHFEEAFENAYRGKLDRVEELEAKFIERFSTFD